MVDDVSTQTNEELWGALFDSRQRALALGCLHTRAQSGDASAQWVYAQWLSWDSKRGYRAMRGRARTWLERAAGGGHPDALHELGHLVYPLSPSQAIELYERAARQGSALAHWTLGLEYERSKKHGALRKARAHYSRCSEALPPYCWKLGELHFFGIGGAKRVGAALKLFRRAHVQASLQRPKYT